MPTQLSDAWEVKEWLQNAMQLDLDQHDWMKTLLQEFAALGANRESDIRGIPSWKIHNLKGIMPEPYRKKFDVAIQKKNNAQHLKEIGFDHTNMKPRTTGI